MLSVVVPTYNEAGSIPKLAERLRAALAGREWELVVVDDGSPDGTADIAAALAPRVPVNVVRRAGKAGLASAV
ncbi:MAG TPA: glycosyltransferase, partial [Candidatus Limnocylindria bacterium]|nr:glycosyltransferase [Candidatus Limnocylindria bacterium]